MGDRSARGNDDAVQTEFFYLLCNMGDAVLRAGVEVVLGMDHAGQLVGITRDVGYIEEAPDVGPAVTDKNTYTGFLFFDIAFRRVFRRSS